MWRRRWGTDILRVPRRCPVSSGGRRTRARRTGVAQWRLVLGQHRRLLAAVRDGGGHRVLSGLWGDHVTRDTMYLADLLRRMHWLSLQQHLWELPRWMTDSDARELRRAYARSIVAKSVGPRARRVVRRLRSGATEPSDGMAWLGERIRGRTPLIATPLSTGGSAHARSLYLNVRAKHHAWSIESNDKLFAGYGLQIAYPFLDRDLVSLLMSIPGDVISYQGVPRALVRRGLESSLPTSVRTRRWKGDLGPMIHEVSSSESTRVANWFRRGSVAAMMGYLNEEVLFAQLDAWGRGTGYDAERRLGELVGLESWLRAYFGRGMT